MLDIVLIGIGVLFVQEIPRAVNDTHAASPKQAFKAITSCEYVRCFADATLAGCHNRRRVGKGEIRGMGTLFTHGRITTAVRLSRAGPRKTSAKSCSNTLRGEARPKALPRVCAPRPWYRPSLHSKNVSPG